jgi:hypothetical protein
VYLVLGWLAGTVSKQVVERAIKAATDGLVGWMTRRRWNARGKGVKQVEYILGPDVKLLKEVEVDSRTRSRDRQAGSAEDSEGAARRYSPKRVAALSFQREPSST